MSKKKTLNLISDIFSIRLYRTTRSQFIWNIFKAYIKVTLGVDVIIQKLTKITSEVELLCQVYLVCKCSLLLFLFSRSVIISQLFMWLSLILLICYLYIGATKNRLKGNQRNASAIKSRISKGQRWNIKQKNSQQKDRLFQSNLLHFPLICLLSGRTYFYSVKFHVMFQTKHWVLTLQHIFYNKINFSQLRPLFCRLQNKKNLNNRREMHY